MQPCINVNNTDFSRINIHHKPFIHTHRLCYRLIGLLAVVLFMTVTNSASAATDYLWESAVSGNWNIPSLWAPDGTPDSNADTVTINATGSAYTVTLNINADLSDFTLSSSDATLSAISKTLTVVNSASLLKGSVLWQSSTWADDGGGTLSNSANMTVRGTSNINTNVFGHNGQLTIQGSSAGNATLTIANGFANFGTINLDSIDGAYNSNFYVTSGILMNQDQININQGVGGNRTFGANLENNAVVNINTNTTFLKSEGSYTNNAYFNIATDKTLTISSYNQQFNQDGGTLDVDGTFSMSSATFNFNGGTITGNAPIIYNSSLNIDPFSTGAASFSIQGNASTFSGDIAPSQTVTVLGRSGTSHATLTATNGFTNSGTINLDSTDAAYQSNLDVSSGTLTNEGQININEGTVGGARRLGANLDNNGTVNINTDTTFLKSEGSYTNNANFNIATDKTLTISSYNQQFNQDGGTLAVDGTFSMTSAAFNFNGGTITGNAPIIRNSSLNIGAGSTGSASFSVQGNSSTLSGDTAPGQTVTVLGCSGGSHATLTAADGFTNSGTINLDSIDGAYQSNLYVSSGTLTNEGQININEGTVGGARTLGANLDNNGTVNINTDTTFLKADGSYTNNANFNIATDKTLTISSNYQQFNQDGGTLAVDGTFSMTSAAFNFNGGTITGNAPIIRNSSLNIGAGSTGSASFSVQGNASTLSGDIAPEQTVTVLGCSGGSHAALTADNGFTNYGTINLDSINGGYYSKLYVNSGTLTNEGQINVNEGTAGARTLSAELANNGIVNINRTVSLGRSAANHINLGDFSILEPAAIVTVTGNTFTNAASGTISGVGTLNVSGVSFVNNGTISPGLSPGILSITGDYIQYDTGILNIEIGGTVVGTDYDQLAVTGDVSLDGDLIVSLLGGFTPDYTDMFTILVTSGAGNYIEGVFHNALDGTVNVIGGGTFDVFYTDTEVQLTNFVIPEPATVFLLGLGGLALVRKRIRALPR